MVQCMASAPSTALLEWTTRARRRATRTRSNTRWGWRSNANLALAAHQALAHIVVATISTVLAGLALLLARWGWRSNANLALSAHEALADIVVATISTALAGLALRLARGLKARDELAALCVPLTTLARWQVDVATPPALSLRPHVDETLALPHLVASLRAGRHRCALDVVDFVGAMASVAIQRKVTLVTAAGIPI